MDAIEAHAVTASLEGRIHVLWQRRAVDRRVYGAAWPQGRHDRDVELRALVRVARAGRRLARQTMEQADLVTASRAAADLNPYPEPPAGWQENELAMAWGR